MPDPYPDGGRPRPRAHAATSVTPRTRRSVLPLLLATALTLVAVLAAMRGDGGSETPTGTAASVTGGQTQQTDEAADMAEDALADMAGTAPPSAPTTAPEPTSTVRVEDLPVSGSGEFVGAPAAGAPFGATPHRRFAVAVETGIGVDVAGFAAFVDTILADERSWIGDGVTGFRRVGSDETVDFTIVVATPTTVDRLCAPLQTAGRYSCAANGWVALNLHRWMTATPEWPASLETYRHYLVNHEVGHYILGPDHPGCPEPGALAPIMMQQTIDLAGCRPNGWVFPERA